jgi:Dehydrogenases with different specificities (related to short-chain alcohol dehydrogenases)
MPDLSGKVFIITGGNGGIGLGLAEGIADAGGSVAIWARNTEKSEAAVSTLQKRGAESHAFTCDVSSEDDVQRCMQETLSVFGRIDGLFANAGRGGTGTPFVDVSLEEWRKIMAVNLDGVFLTLREAARHLIDQGTGGSLVAVSSTSAVHGAGEQ